MSSCPKGKKIKRTSQEVDIKNRHPKSKCCDSVISKKVKLELFIDNIEHNSNYIYLLLHFLFGNFQHLSGISDKYVLRFIFITICKEQHLQNS